MQLDVFVNWELLRQQGQLLHVPLLTIYTGCLAQRHVLMTFSVLILRLLFRDMLVHIIVIREHVQNCLGIVLQLCVQNILQEYKAVLLVPAILVTMVGVHVALEALVKLPKQ